MSIISAPPRQLASRSTAPTASVRRLSFSRHMPPGAVHKASATEVFLTDAIRLDEDRFTVAARWHRDRFLHHDFQHHDSRRHDFRRHDSQRHDFRHQEFRHHDGDSGQVDPLLLVETVRQALIHVTHRFYGVPQGHPFVLNTLEFDLLEGGTAIRRGGQIPVVLDITCTRQAKTPRRLGMTLDAVASVDGARIGRVRMHWEVLDARLYAVARNRTRQQAEARPAGALPRGLRRLDPREVGYAHDEHVLLTRDPEAAPGAFWLDMNPGHPVLFDHPCDHVPGMVLLEAFRQAVTATGAPLRPTLTRISAAFKTFGETDAPVSITARPTPARPTRPSTAEITAVQGETTLVSARVAYQLPQGPRRHGVAS